jgi:hypothetical protein
MNACAWHVAARIVSNTEHCEAGSDAWHWNTIHEKQDRVTWPLFTYKQVIWPLHALVATWQCQAISGHSVFRFSFRFSLSVISLLGDSVKLCSTRMKIMITNFDTWVTRRMKWEDDQAWCIGENLEAGYFGLWHSAGETKHAGLCPYNAVLPLDLWKECELPPNWKLGSMKVKCVLGMLHAGPYMLKVHIIKVSYMAYRRRD